MKFDHYLKRQKTSVSKLVDLIGAKSYKELNEHLRAVGIKCPPEDKLEYEFKNDVEERATFKSSSKEKRVSSSKGDKSETNASSSSGRSKSKQRVRKSPVKRQRKRKSNKVESVQPASGSEDIK